MLHHIPRPTPPSPAPRTPVVAIGTAASITTLTAQAAIAGAPIPRWAILSDHPPLRLHTNKPGFQPPPGGARFQPASPSGGAGFQPASPPSPEILGSLADLPTLHARHNFSTAVLAFPPAMSAAADRAAAALRALSIPFRTIPPLADLLDPTTQLPPQHPAEWRPPRSIDLAALIARTPHALDRPAVAPHLSARRILITGAGGSIGSHLAHVAAEFAPEQLLLMDRSENALFEIDRQIAARHPALPRRALLHDAADRDETLRLLAFLRPHVVFHAAAHKHVPLMQDHPAHALVNNFLGTRSIADAAAAAGADRFVMISSDKAVNPRSVMGATKRLAEMYVQGLGSNPSISTRASMVRFGNVLGSACSVLTIWSSQIAEGGPITITDPRMTRYFMTIPEAATLVIQSLALLNHPSGSIFVLDMGHPVPILDLARRFSLAHGLRPVIDWSTAPLGTAAPRPPATCADPADSIPIVFTGARPGEKLHEELAYAAERLAPTTHPGIRSWRPTAAESPDPALIADMTADLSAFRTSTDHEPVLAAIARYIPTIRLTPS